MWRGRRTTFSNWVSSHGLSFNSCFATMSRLFYSYFGGETKKEKFHIQSWMKVGGHFIETAENGTKSRVVTCPCVSCVRLENFIKSLSGAGASEYNWSWAFYCQTFTNFKSTFTTILKCSKTDTKQFYTLSQHYTPTSGQSLLMIGQSMRFGWKILF